MPSQEVFHMDSISRARFSSTYDRSKIHKDSRAMELLHRGCRPRGVLSHACMLFLFFALSENLRRIAIMSCPPELDKTSSRCAEDFDTNFVFQDAFDGLKLKGGDTELLQIASVLGRGSLKPGTLVCQVFHWFYVHVGSPRATTSYIVSVLCSESAVLQ